MPTFHSFEEIEAWKAARILTRKIRGICKREICRKDFAFVDQITRSVRSISANIAEGFEASSVAAFVSFLGIAKGSAGETRSHLYDALDEGYITQAEFADLAHETVCISKMIASLMAYLRSSDVDQAKRRIKMQTSKPPNQ